MPNNLLQNLNWAFFSKIELENTDVADDVSTCSKSLQSFWKRRPSRLLHILKAYDDFRGLFRYIDSEIERLRDNKGRFYYSKSQQTEILKLAQKLDEEDINETLFSKSPSTPPLVTVPLVLENNLLPQVYFDSFIEFTEDSFKDPSNDFLKTLQKDAEKRYSKLNENFKPHNAKTVCIALPATIEKLSGLRISGDSDNLGYWVERWLKHNNITDFPPLCCTGQIDKHGQIREISHYDIKLEAWISTQEGYFLVPEENKRKEEKATPGVIGFNNLEELEHWLRLNTGKEPRIRKVRSWLANDRKEPEYEDFVAFFDKINNSYVTQAAYFREAMLPQNCENRYAKLKTIAKHYEQYLKQDCNRFYKLPQYIRIALTPWLADQMQEFDTLYRNTAEKFANSSHDTYLASRFVLSNCPEEILQSHAFTKNRKYYPMLLWLFFRDPAEMLYTFSLLPDLSSYETNLLKQLLESISKHFDDYTDEKSDARADSQIMQEVMAMIDPEAIYKAASAMQTRKKLPLLYKASLNFAKTAQALETVSPEETTIFKDAELLCCRIIKEHINQYLAKRSILRLKVAELSSDDIRKAICALFENLPNLRNSAILKGLCKAINNCDTNKDCSKPDTSNQHGSKNILNGILSNLADESKAKAKKSLYLPDWLPQPGIIFLKNATNSRFWQSKSLKLLKAFEKDNHRTAATALRRHCLHHFSALMLQACNPEQPDIFKAARKGLPYLTALLTNMSAENQEKLIGEISANIKLKLEELYWYFLLPEQYQTILLNKLIDEIMSHRVNSDVPDDSNEQSKINLGFFSSLLEAKGLLSKADKTIIKHVKYWNEAVEDFDNDPLNTRRTVVALKPLYHLLVEPRNKEKADESLETSSFDINNSQFAVEYINCFAMHSEHFKLPNKARWYSSLDGEIFNSLLLTYCSVKQPQMLPEVVADYVDDLANLVTFFSEQGHF
ncbi:MAG: hypothetical protein GX221_11700 [Candidatus Riflebacteria bacterium]|nr:hypothetical protein [Candidatus Riflebacteria bacterium]